MAKWLFAILAAFILVTFSGGYILIRRNEPSLIINDYGVGIGKHTKPGYKDVWYNVTFINNDKDNRGVSILFFALYDASNESYKPSAEYADLFESDTTRCEMAPHEQRTGTVIFEIPFDATPAKLVYRDAWNTVSGQFFYREVSHTRYLFKP
jgi:hypothetical protein